MHRTPCAINIKNMFRRRGLEPTKPHDLLLEVVEAQAPEKKCAAAFSAGYSSPDMHELRGTEIVVFKMSSISCRLNGPLDVPKSH